MTDDIQVFGTDDYHDLHIHEAMERTWKAGIKLYFDKCIVGAKSCKSFGNVYIPQEVMPDPRKVQAIKQMQAVPTRQELQSFLGMVNYLSQFVTSMYVLTPLLRKLLKWDIFFNRQNPMKIHFRS